MAILHFVSAKVAARASARVRWYSELNAKSGKVLFVPPSEQVILQSERFVFKELESDELADVLSDESFAKFAEWQLYESYRLYENEPHLPPWPFREVYFFAPATEAEMIHETIGRFKINNIGLERPKDAMDDSLKYRFYVDRSQLASLESALKAAQVCGHCKESLLYICRDPDGPSK